MPARMIALARVIMILFRVNESLSLYLLLNSFSKFIFDSGFKSLCILYPQYLQKTDVSSIFDLQLGHSISFGCSGVEMEVRMDSIV